MIKKRPLFWLTILFASGIITGYYIPFIYIFCSGLIIGFIFILYLYISERNFKFSSQCNKIIVFTILCILSGICWLNFHKGAYDSKFSIAHWNYRGNLLIIGEIVEDLRTLEGNKLYLKPYFVEKDQKQYPVKYGLIALNRNYLSVKLNNGDLIKTELFLEEPGRQLNPGGFSYYKFLKRKGIYSQGFAGKEITKLGHVDHVIKDIIISVKNEILSLIELTLHPPARAIVKAVLLGERENLPQTWQDKFTNAGANHLLAISGLHVGFILFILLAVFNICRLPPGLKNLLISFFMVFYIILTGGRVSVLRAGILATLFLWAPYFDREGDLFNILGLTALINLIINPYVLFNIGFQLTYMVLIMIVLWVDIFKELSLKIFAVSLAAQLGSAPITAYYFNQITPVGLMTNIWAIPLMAMIVFVEFIGLIIGLLHPVFALITGKLTEFMIYLMGIGISGMIKIPFSKMEIASPTPWQLFVIFSYLLFLPIIIKPRFIFSNREKRLKKIVVLIVVAVILIGGSLFISLLQNELEIICFAVGQGDSILLKSPQGKYILIDGGGKSGRDSDQGQKVILPYLRQKGIKRLGAVFATHFDNDHVLGLASILKQRKVDLLVIPTNFTQNKLSRKIMTIAMQKKIPVKLANKNNFFKTGQLRFEILNPYNSDYTKRNNNSIVVKLKYKNFSMLLTGDLEQNGENRLIDSDISLQSDILKLGHHGSNTSSGRYFLKKVEPEEGIISVGKNYYGHPSLTILQRLQDLNINIWRTDKQGAIMIKTKGDKYRIYGFKK